MPFEKDEKMTAVQNLHQNVAVPFEQARAMHLDGVGKVRMGFGSGMSDDYANDPDAQDNFTKLKDLLDEVNVEDRGCTEKVYRGLCSTLAKPGYLSYLERSNYDFAQYINAMIATAKA